jgi:hypothetical protein
MENSPINSLIDILAVSGYSRIELERVMFQHGGHLIIPVEFLGFVGGNLTQIMPDQYGRMIYKNLIVSPLLACGHVTKSINEIAGTCYVCKRLICTQCLLTCELTGVLVCPKHSTMKNGIVISNHAKKGLWRLKVRKIINAKELGYYERKQLTYNAK